MRSLRFIFIGIITFLFVTNAVFLRRTVSYSFLGDYRKADAAEPSKDFSVVQKDEQKIAGCFLGVCVNLPKIPVSIPTVPSSPTSSDDNKPSIDLTGTWIGEGYQCPRGTLHDHVIVKIEVNGNSLVATKVDSAGDQCVPLISIPCLDEQDIKVWWAQFMKNPAVWAPFGNIWRLENCSGVVAQAMNAGGGDYLSVWSHPLDGTILPTRPETILKRAEQLRDTCLSTSK